MDVNLLIRTVLGRAVQDLSFADVDVLGYINEGLATVAGLVPLPRLETLTTVEADPAEESIPLPEDFLVHLRYAYSLVTRRKLLILSNLVRLREATSRHDAGSVKRVAVSGDRLFYSPSPPSYEQIEIVYHRKPPEYAGGEDEQDIMPEHIGPRILLAYACRKMYAVTEAKAQEHKENFAYWDAQYRECLEELKAFLGPLYNRPVNEMRIFDAMGL